MREWLIAGLLFAQSAKADVGDALILAVSFDELPLRDRSATKAPLELVGNPLHTTGLKGFAGALDFSADPDAAVLVNYDFGTLKELSISVHLNVLDPHPPRWDYILDTRSLDVDLPEGAFYLARNREGMLRMADSAIPSDAYPRKEWFHLVILADRKGVSFYVDGNRVGMEPAVGLNVGNRLVLGNRFTLHEGLFGQIDDLGMWNRLLNFTEMEQLKKEPIPFPLFVSAREKTSVLWARLKSERNSP